MSGSNPVQVNEALVNASIEQITEMALKAQAEAGGDQSGAVVEKDVSASSGQTEEQKAAAEAARQDGEAKAKSPESDKEVNFAKLRTKTTSLEQEVARLAEENKRLAERQYVSELPADHAQKVAEVDAKLAEIGAKFQEGTLTFDEFQEGQRKATAEREQLLAVSIKAQISKEMQEQQEKEAAERAAAETEKNAKTWQETVDGFITSKPDSVDYATDEAKQKDLNTYVKALAADADNSDKPMDWFLKEAHALVKSKHGIAVSAPAKKEEPETPAKPGNVIPFHTLSDVPGGVPPAKSEIEQLDQVSGAALSNRFLNDPAQIDKLLASLG